MPKKKLSVYLDEDLYDQIKRKISKIVINEDRYHGVITEVVVDLLKKGLKYGKENKNKNPNR